MGDRTVTKWVLDGVSESTRASVSLETHTLSKEVPLRTTFQPAMTHEARDVCADGIQGLRVNWKRHAWGKSVRITHLNVRGRRVRDRDAPSHLS